MVNAIRGELDIRRFYAAFAEKNIASMATAFVSGAVYEQNNTNLFCNGAAGVERGLLAWHRHITGMTVHIERIAQMGPEQAGEFRVDGAVKGCIVQVTIRGQYVFAFPGLAVARKQPITLPAINFMWLDKDGKIIRMENEFWSAALFS